MSEREEQPSNPSEVTPRKASMTKTLAVSGLIFAAALVAGRYVAGPSVPPKTAPATASATPSAAAADKVYAIPVSMSQAILGPEDALVTLVQWCDFPDPGCKAAEPAVQALLKRYPNDLRLVFRHYFLDKSSPAHQFSRAAYEQGNKFWEARALLLADDGPYSDEKLEAYAKQLGLNWEHTKSAIDKQLFITHLLADRMFAVMFDVKAAPGFFVNGRALAGVPTEQALDTLIQSELVRARTLVQKGVEKKNVYAELIKGGAWTNPAGVLGKGRRPSDSAMQSSSAVQ